MSKFGQEIDVQHPVFFGPNNSDKANFGSKFDSNNRNIKKVVFKFKIRT